MPSKFHPIRCFRVALWSLCLAWQGPLFAADREPIQPQRLLNNPASKDQDDMCFWVHPQDRLQSTVIASDKSAGFLFVYDLAGKLLQEIEVPKPGNIDIRQNVKLDGKPADVVVVNQRSDGFKLCVFRVDAKTRRLERLDKENVPTGPNYGGCLYHSAKTGKLFFLCTSEAGTVEQHELAGDGNGGVSGKKVRTWPVGKCEGAVADDRTSTLFISEESKGIWKVGAEPDDATPGELIAAVGEKDGLTGDLEGLAVFHRTDQSGALIVSDQGSHRYVLFDLESPHRRIGEFRIAGATETDGIDLLPIPLGDDFPQGVFACHTDTAPRPVLLSSWAEILATLDWPAK